MRKSGRRHTSQSIDRRRFGFVIPHDEPDERNRYAHCTDAIRQCRAKIKRLGRNAQICAAHRRHKQGRHKCDKVVLLANHQKHRDSPQCKYRQSLIAPCKILPYNFETVGIAKAIYKHKHRHNEYRNADKQTFRHWMLVDVEKIGYDEPCRAQCCVAACNGSSHNPEQSEQSTECAEPIF